MKENKENTNVHVLTLAEANPEHLPEIVTLLRELIALCRQEEGCLRFDLYADARRPHVLNTLEVWESPQAHRRHLDSAHVRRIVMALIGKIRGLPEMRVLHALDEFPE